MAWFLPASCGWDGMKAWVSTFSHELPADCEPELVPLWGSETWLLSVFDSLPASC